MSSRYAIVSALYSPHRGGVETFSENLAHQLAIEGDAVTVVTSRLSANDPAYEVQDDGVMVWRLPCRPLMNGRLPLVQKNREFKAMMARIADEGFDGVLVNARFYGMSVEGLRLARQAGAPAIVLDHGADWLTMGNPMVDAVIRGYERLMTERVKSFGPRFAGISRKSAEWLRTFGIDTDLVISNAIDAEAFRRSSSGRDFRRELGIADDQKVVAFVGRLEPEKGPVLVSRALGELGLPYVGVLAGEGSQRAEIESLHLDNVRLVGNVTHEDVSSLLSQADAFCLPTRSEGFCLAVLEAASWGVPVAMPDVGVVREALGDAFVLIREPYEDLAARIAEAVELDATSTQHKVEELFSWKATAQQVRTAFAQIARD